MQINLRGTVCEVPDLAEARRLWVEFRDRTGEGVSTLGNGVDVTRDGEAIARISYNGRVWALDGTELVSLNPSLEVVRSDQGDGGWSIHVEGEEPDNCVLSGPSEPDDADGWQRPNEADFALARDLIRTGERGWSAGLNT